MTSTTTTASRSKAFAVILIAVVMAQFDLWVVNTAAPRIQADLSATSGAMQIVVGGYSLAYGTLLVAGGRLGDTFGRAFMLRVGVIAFAVASLLCAAAQNSVELVIGRLLQGACAAVMVPQVLGLISRLYGPTERRMAMSWFGVVFGLGAALGQVVGGLLVTSISGSAGWRAIFLIVVPLAAASYVLLGRIFPREAREGPVSMDLPGLAGLSIALLLLFLALALGPAQGWPWWIWPLLGAAVAVAAGTVVRVRRVTRHGFGAEHLILDPRLFSEPTFRTGLLVNAAYFLAFGGFLFAMTFTLQAGLGESPLRSGLTFLPQGLGFAVGSLIALRMTNRLGPRLVAVGATCSTVACLLVLIGCHLGRAEMAPWRLTPAMSLLGLGNGLAIPAMIASLLAVIPARYAGTAAGMLTTTQQVAMAFGVVVFGLVLSSSADGPTTAASYLPALKVELIIDAALIALGGLASLRLPFAPATQGMPAPDPEELV